MSLALAHSSSHVSSTVEMRSVRASGSLLSFKDLRYAIKSKGDGGSKFLIDGISIDVRAGELLAIMGPSGAGKSTLLDVYLNGEAIGAKEMHKVSSFVEQEDALLGVMTVRESISYALRLHSPLLSRAEVNQRVERVVNALGLQSCANQRIGTPISRGISGGQKRRVTAACAMVTLPRILFLDEVTSGLDSTSAREVILAISKLSREEGMIVIATIHQPSLETISQFTNIAFLAGGKLCYSGRVDALESFFEKWGRPVGRFTNPSDHAMNFLNNDFSQSADDSKTITEFREFYLSTLPSKPEKSESYENERLLHARNRVTHRSFSDEDMTTYGKAGTLMTLFWNTLVLAERTSINYRRNILAYGVRAGMYGGMGFMLAVIWIRLGTADSTINDRLSVHFYSVAFLAFFLEERAVYLRETKNRLYTTLPFMLSNALINMPFLFACTVLFTLICYWAIGLHQGAAAFFRFVGFLFLSLMAAKTQALVVASLLPIFVAALAVTAFVNGFWMSIGGYFIKARSLPRFWFYSFHYMDFQKYAFELLINSDFNGVTFSCDAIVDGVCSCVYPTSTPETCTVSGQDVLNYLDVGGISYGKWRGILVSIVTIYRIILYMSLKIRS